jgi:hypothetical protein
LGAKKMNRIQGRVNLFGRKRAPSSDDVHMSPRVLLRWRRLPIGIPTGVAGFLTRSRSEKESGVALLTLARVAGRGLR